MQATSLETGKCTGLELSFLESLGWAVKDAWCVEGKEPVTVSQPDRWSTYIIDARFVAFKADYLAKLAQ